MLRILLFVFISIFYCSIAYAGAWVQEEGHGLNIFTYRRYISHQFWTSAGRLQGSPTYAKNELDEYFEFGFTKQLTMGFYLSGLQSHTAAAGTHSGSYDNLVFGRYLVWKSDWSAISVQAFVDRLGNAVAFNIPANNSHFNTGEALLFGTSGKIGADSDPKEDKKNSKKEVKKDGKKNDKKSNIKNDTKKDSSSDQYWFFGTLIGVVQRYSAGNQLQVNLEGGLKLYDSKLLLMLQNYNTFSLDHPFYPQGAGYNLMTIAPSVVYMFTKAFGFQAGVTQDFYGQNVGKGKSFFLASWIQF